MHCPLQNASNSIYIGAKQYIFEKKLSTTRLSNKFFHHIILTNIKFIHIMYVYIFSILRFLKLRIIITDTIFIQDIFELALQNHKILLHD